MTERPVLVIYRGLPASGKSTLARRWVAEAPLERARVNRDDLRQMLHGGYVEGGHAEKFVVGVRDRLIRQLLHAGVSVACDDTNLPARTVRVLAAIAGGVADVEYVDLTDVAFDECVARDRARPDGVGVKVIQGMYERFVKGNGYPLSVPSAKPEPPPAVPYVAKAGTRPAIMVDLDGTLCLHNGRSPYDESRVGEDLPNVAVVEVVQRFADDGYWVVFCSGRSEDCREASEAWIAKHVGGYLSSHISPPLFGSAADVARGELLMRLADDKRQDAIVKREMFDHEIRDYYDVRFVLDDRQRVVDEWRRLGLTVFQVAPGDF